MYESIPTAIIPPSGKTRKCTNNIFARWSIPLRQNLKLYNQTANPKPNPLVCSIFFSFLGLGLGLVFWLVLGFVLVVYSTGQKYRWHIFWSQSLVFSGYHE